MTALKDEEPFAVVAHTECLSTICSFCFADDKESLTKCIGCRQIYYCNKKCQKGDWANHKKECCLLRREMDSSGELPDWIVRLVARILLKTEKALGQKAFNGRTWDSLDDSVDLTEDCSNTVPEAIVKFMKPMKNVSLEDAAKALRKVLTYQISIFNMEGVNNMGVGIYLGLSVHKHHCVPDSQLLFFGTKASLRSFDPERTTYSPDLVFSFTGIPPWILNRKDVFLQDCLIDCKCSLCVDENHIFNRMGSSCRVSCCVNAAGILDENSTGPYKCNKCGEASDITVKEVKRAETKIQNFLTLTEEDPKYVLDTNYVKSLVHASEKILSVYNYHFVSLCEKIIISSTGEEACEKKDVQMMSREIFDKSLKAMRYYLHETDVILVGYLMDRAILKISLETDDDFNIDEVLDVGMETYGENHRAFSLFNETIGCYRKLNGLRRDILFRQAGRYAW